MDRTISVGTYSRENGLTLAWTSGFVLKVTAGADGEVLIQANREGLISLAQHALTLAEDGVPPGAHLHLSGYDALEPESSDLILERIVAG